MTSDNKATNENIALQSTVAQLQAIRRGEISSRALLEIIIARIERLNGDLNAVITHDFAAARLAADDADKAQARGCVLGPLHGVPITIKDALEVAGMCSTGGAVELREHIPHRDAPAVQALRDAGAIIIGKTNLPRWSAEIQSFNELFGTTVNPWDLSKVPGGSSGGAATAVATGLSSFELGTDIGGSIRLPASFCGVFGHKPSWGIVASSGYLDHAQGGSTEADINVLGPIARSAEDLALILSVLARRSGPLVASLSPAPEDIKSLRVAAWLDDPFCPVDEEVLAVNNAAVEALEAAGVAVDRQARPDIDPKQASTLGMILVSAAMSEPNANDTATTGISHAQWLALHRQREAIREQWAAFFQHYDAILMPVSFVPPFAHDQKGDFGSRTLICNGQPRSDLDLVRWTTLTGMAYLPSTVPPLGLGRSGVPIGLQVVGAYGADYTTIALAGFMADLCGGFSPPPLALRS